MGREHRPSLNESQVESHMQRWMLLSPFHGIAAELRSHHKAGGRQNACPVRLHDSLIDRQGETEIVSGYYDFFQAGLSIPSRE